ncbi:unnamed protein product [Euphydryas editha]|uniref:Uncharacterized protein n=1 Tax=Euphydryas editha TaxID=104508 RepID=A0AAU9TBH5_EUPED|nr:unnamed protein product [Euphydryas editha]
MKGTILFCFVLVASTRSDEETSGISKFWSDDIRVFDKIYGKTSDKELYGETLPPTIRFNINSKTPIQMEASEKKEKYLTSGKNILDTEYYPQDFGDRYEKLFSKSLYPGKSKPSSPLQFISFSDFKPISESTDPETYNYLKKLEKKTAKKKEIAKYLKGHSAGTDSEEDKAYKSIQDILDAHIANKNNDSHEEELPTKTKVNDELRYSRNRNRNKVRSINGNSLNSRCVSGRCRSTPGSLRSRPYVRKIKRYRYSRR